MTVQPQQSNGRQGRGFHYAWVVAGVTFVVLIVTAGIRATPGVLMVSPSVHRRRREWADQAEQRDVDGDRRRNRGAGPAELRFH